MLKKSLIAFVLLLFFSSFSFAQKTDNDRYLITIPDKNWALEVSLPDFSLSYPIISVLGEKKSGRLDAEIKSEGYLLTIIWANTSEKSTNTELRDLASKALMQTPVEKDGYQHSDYKDFSMLEYLIREFQGVELNQKYYNAYIVKDGVRIDIQFSKTSFKPGDEMRFFSILDSVTFLKIPRNKSIE